MKLVENIGCPALDCPESHQIALSHSCCKVCKGMTLIHKATSLLCKNADGSGASDTNRRQKDTRHILNFPVEVTQIGDRKTHATYLHFPVEVKK